jgi:WXG100 family type VII secretion target
MAVDTTQVRYDDLRNVAGQFDASAGQMQAMLTRLWDAFEPLQRGGWRTDAGYDFLRDMEGDLLPAIRRLEQALAEASRVTLDAIAAYESGEEEASGYFAGGGAGGRAGSLAGKAFKDALISGKPVRIGDVDFAKFPGGQFPAQDDVMRMYMSGEISYNEAAVMYKQLGARPPISGFLEGDTTLFEKQLINERGVLWEGAIGNEYGSIQASVLDYQADLTARGTLDLENMRADFGVQGGASAYLARVQGSAEYGGVAAAFDASIGASIEGEAGIRIDPKAGEIRAVAQGEAYIGVEASGSVSWETDYFTVEVQGSVSAGAGAKGNLEVGLQDGILTLDGSVLAAVGVGAGAGVDVQVNVGAIVDDAREGVEDFFGDLFGGDGGGGFFSGFSGGGGGGGGAGGW